MPSEQTLPTGVSFLKWTCVAVLLWGVALFIMVFFVATIGFDDCLTPVGSDVAECASLEALTHKVFDACLAVPVGWVPAALFVWLAPRRLSLARRVAMWVIPALPVAVIAASMIVIVRYGPILS